MSKKSKKHKGYGHIFARKIGSLLRQIRCKQGISLAQAEKDNNIHDGQLEKMELGIIASWRVYDKLFEYYDCDLQIMTNLK